MTRKTGQHPDFIKAVSGLYPGLIDTIKRVIEESEKAYEGKSGEEGAGFLWEHTRHVASLAFALAEAEGLDPVLPSVVALFHDAAKFAGGEYHKGRRSEEEGAARLAARLLRKEGMDKRGIDTVHRALRALYDEKSGRNALAAVVHDADFLSKFGYLGVAGFFIKSTLRGRNLHGAVMNSLSKELTYASVLPQNMRTAAGRKLAGKKSKDSLRFFRDLLQELGETHGSDYRIRRLRVADPDRSAKTTEIRLVVTPGCDICGGGWKTGLFIDKGVKCRRLNVRLRCARCGNGYGISFCLPEIPPAGAGNLPRNPVMRRGIRGSNRKGREERKLKTPGG